MRNKQAQARHLELSFLVGRFVTDHLIRVHHLFEGDLVAALVLATIANRNMQRYYEDVARKSAAGLDKLVEAQEHLAHLRHCNAHSVASATGIPRETVRRKVRWLEQKGWLTVGARGELSIPSGIGKQFAQFDAETIDRFFETAGEGLQVLHRNEDPTASRLSDPARPGNRVGGARSLITATQPRMGTSPPACTFVSRRSQLESRAEIQYRGPGMPLFNTHRGTTSLTLSVLLLALVGCAPKLATPEGYPTLYVSPDNDNVLVFAKPGLDFSPYRRVMIEPTEVHLPDAEGIDIEAVQKELANYVDAMLNEKLSRSFEIVAKPAPDVLRIRFRIVGAEATSKAQLVMMVPPFSMVNMVSPKGAFTGSVTLAGEFLEGDSKEASAAFVAYGSRPGIDATVAFRRWDAAKKVIDKVTERLASDLEALRSAG